MKPIILLVGLFGATLVVGVDATTTTRTETLTTTTAVFGAPRGHAHLTGVRAEFVARSRGTLGQIDTEIVIVNTHGTRTITLLNIYVLGRDGVKTVLKVYGGLNGVIPPLGQVVLPIATIGVRAGVHTAPKKGDVASVIVAWEGLADTMKVTAIIQQWELSRSTDGFRGMSIAEGYNVPF